MSKNRNKPHNPHNKKVQTPPNASDASQPDVSVEDAMAELRSEIMEECYKLANNQIMTVHNLIEKTKELQVLENEKTSTAH